ncbi:MAG: efflux RND transporter permease subunit [Verrucomicrobia bacterium]|nr:efflux RND transporter permease subunit [Verrucomicrobiota bacterium]
MVKAALKNPHAVVVLALAIFVIGLTAMTRISTDILPTFKTPAVQVLTLYPGMPADVMERDLTARLERWTGQANGVARQESKSMVGVSVVRDFFREDIDPNTAMSQVSSLAMSDLYYLPPGTIPPMVMPFDPTASLPLCLIGVSSPTYDETKLYDVAYFELRNRLQGLPGVIAPAVYGGKLRRILAYVDREKAQVRGLSPLDVMRAIQGANTMIPTGDAKFGALDYQINANGMVATVADMNKIPITMGGGPPVYVGDVAQVEDSHQIQQNVVHLNGKRQVYIPIYRQPGANTIAVVDGIKAALKPILERIPGINLDVVMDQSVYVRQSIRNLVQEAIVGFLLAAGMVFLFLGSYRPTLIVIIALPLACLGAFIGLYFTHQTLNAMTLGGLALVIGLLIDESIVVLENTSRHLSLGKSAFQAALEGAGEVTRPLTIVTVTIIVVFFPVVFISGIGKFLFTPLAMSVIFAILTSRLLATTLVPVCAAKFFNDDNGDSPTGMIEGNESPEATPKPSSNLPVALGGSRGATGEWSGPRSDGDAGWFFHLQRSYGGLLERTLRFRWLVLGAVAVLFLASIALFKGVGTELFPQVDAGQFMIRLRSTPGLRIELTERLATEVENYVRLAIPQSERKMIIANIGVLYDWPAAYTPNSGSQDAFILVQLVDHHKKSVFDYVDELRQRLPREFPGAEFNFDTGGLMTAALNFGLPSPIDIQVEGNKLEVAHTIAENLKRFAQTVPGTVDVRIEQRLDAPQISVDVDRVKAARLGLSQETVVKNIVTAFNSSINFAPSFWVDENNGNHYFVGAQYREEDIRSLDTLRDIPITDKEQPVPIPLRNVARIHHSNAPVEINHFNITRVTDVFVNVRGRDVGSVAADIERYIDRFRSDRSQVPEGYFIQMRGEVKSMRDSFRSLGFGFMLAVVLVYLVLVFQFRSFLDPFIVMFAVPLGLIGVAWMLSLTGTSLNIQSLMGSIMMVGIVVSFSVLLVEFANHLRAEARAKGVPKSVREAVVEAAAIRLRPILMTGLSAVLGLTPMAIAGGANIPLARAVIGGVLAAMVMVLFVVPMLYLMFKGEKPTQTAS